MIEVEYLGHVSLASKVRRAFWIVCSYFLFKPFVTNIFSGWRRLVLRLFGAKVGHGANIYPSVKIWAPWNMNIGADSCIGPSVICYNMRPITIGEKTVVSQYAYLCTAGHVIGEVNNAHEGLIVAPIVIGRESWIGTRAYVGMGVEIGDRSVVGATSSVYKDVDPLTVVGGNPAKELRKIEK